MRVLFLYTELADYFLKCCDELAKHAEVHIVRYPVNKEAPFNFENYSLLNIYNKRDFSRKELFDLSKKINPDILICAGWIDKDYLWIAKKYFKKIPTVMTCDTYWNGSLKQCVFLFLSRFYLLNKFSHAWVPGQAQKNYVKKLGFNEGKIKTDFYCCDLERFNDINQIQKEEKRKKFPKVFLYVGRYYDFKGVTDLWNAFIELKTEEKNDWELWCLGTGTTIPIKHPSIKHLGFVQPKDLEPILQKAGVFVLPSRFEPWGVVVQEYASAGFPLLLSSAVGAKEIFLEENKNGFEFDAQDIASLKQVLKKIMHSSESELLLMAEESHHMAQNITKEMWVKTLFEMINVKQKILRNP